MAKTKAKPINQTTIRVDKIESTIDKIHNILYDKDLTFLEISIIADAIWTNCNKDKLVQLAMVDIRKSLEPDLSEIDKITPKPRGMPGVS